MTSPTTFAPRFCRAIAARPKLRAMALKYTVADPTHLAADFVECPTRIVWGELDTLLPLRQGREYARRIRGSEFHVIEGAGHLPMVEKPTEFNATLGHFLAGLGE